MRRGWKGGWIEEGVVKEVCGGGEGGVKRGGKGCGGGGEGGVKRGGKGDVWWRGGRSEEVVVKGRFGGGEGVKRFEDGGDGEG